MKNLILCIGVLLLASCYFDDDLNNYDGKGETAKVVDLGDYYWFVGGAMVSGVDSCQVVGWLENESNPDDIYSINRKCLVSHDTVYVTQKDLAPHHNVLNGRIYVGEEQYEVYEKLR